MMVILIDLVRFIHVQYIGQILFILRLTADEWDEFTVFAPYVAGSAPSSSLSMSVLTIGGSLFPIGVLLDRILCY